VAARNRHSELLEKQPEMLDECHGYEHEHRVKRNGKERFADSSNGLWAASRGSIGRMFPLTFSTADDASFRRWTASTRPMRTGCDRVPSRSREKADSGDGMDIPGMTVAPPGMRNANTTPTQTDALRS